MRPLLENITIDSKWGYSGTYDTKPYNLEPVYKIVGIETDKLVVIEYYGADDNEGVGNKDEDFEVFKFDKRQFLQYFLEYPNIAPVLHRVICLINQLKIEGNDRFYEVFLESTL